MTLAELDSIGNRYRKEQLEHRQVTLERVSLADGREGLLDVEQVGYSEGRAAVLLPDGGVELVPVADVTVLPWRNNPVVSQYGP